VGSPVTSGNALGGGAPVALAVEGISKTFAGPPALDAVSLTVRAGEVHGLLGANGSGKSTLIKILAGVYHADSGNGKVSILGHDLPANKLTPEAVRDAGARFVHQNSAVFQDLTIAENFAIGRGFATVGPAIRWPEERRRAQALIDRFKIRARPDDLLKSLRPSGQTMVAIARALQDVHEGHRALLVLDEPTASLPGREVEILLASLRELVSDGHSILYVGHRIDEILDFTDTVTVLRDGRRVVSRSTQGLTRDALVEYIAGRPFQEIFSTSVQHEIKGTRLEVNGLIGGPLRGVSFNLRSGEILGIAGLLGSGRSETLRALFGALPVESGSIVLDGRPVSSSNPTDAMEKGIALIPEDRDLDAAFLDLSVEENLTIASTGRYRRRLRFDNRKQRADSLDAINRFRIRTAGPDARMATLSGGNRQKVVLARWLQREPKVLLLDEPTQGVDIGSRADVYEAVRTQVAEGMSVLLVSSDFEELADVCDRVLILSRGLIVGEVTANELSADRLTELVFRAEETA
jgi:ribose transport system ATP-binding protein